MKRITKILLALLLSLAITQAEKRKEIERTIPTKRSDRIELRGFASSKIDFRSWQKDEISVRLKIVVASSDESYEDAYTQNVDLESTDKGGTLTVSLKQPSMTGRGGFSWSNLLRGRFNITTSVDITGEIYLPRTNPLLLEAHYGSFSLEDMSGDLTLEGKSSTIRLKNCSSLRSIDNDYGTTVVEQCGGNLRLASKSSNITIDGFAGPSDIEADYATIKLHDAAADVHVKSKSATITVEHVGGDLTVEADYSTLVVSDVKGFVDIHDQSGSIKVKSVEGIAVDALYSSVEVASVSGKSGKSLKVKGQSGRLELADVAGDLFIENPYSTMVLKNVKGNVELSGQSATVSAENITGNWKSRTSYSTLSVSGLSARLVDVTNKSNSVDIELITMPTKVDIANEYGDVDVSLPGGFSGDVRLKATYGNVRSNLPLEVESMGSGAIAIGKVGAGTASLRVETTSANVRVMQR